jgi:hypothetical protein
MRFIIYKSSSWNVEVLTRIKGTETLSFEHGHTKVHMLKIGKWSSGKYLILIY